MKRKQLENAYADKILFFVVENDFENFSYLSFEIFLNNLVNDHKIIFKVFKKLSKELTIVYLDFIMRTTFIKDKEKLIERIRKRFKYTREIEIREIMNIKDNSATPFYKNIKVFRDKDF